MNTSSGPTAGEPIEIDGKGLLEAIDTSFSLEELSTLCFALGIDIDNLEAAGKKGKARKLIEYCVRSSRIPELLALCEEERPEGEWDAFIRITSTQELPDDGIDRPEDGIEPEKPEETSKKWLLLGVAAVAIIALIALVIWATGILSPTEVVVTSVPAAVRFRENALEVDESQGAAEFTVELNGSRTETVTVPYETNDISATAGEDYEAVQDVLTFNPDEGAKTIAIPVIRDGLDGEEDESLQLVLTDLQDRPVAATLTIKDLPSPEAGLRAPDLEVDESQGTAEFMVELAGGWTRAVTILYETSDDAAAAGDDYEESSGVLVFEPGEKAKTITVPLVLDWLGGEGDETFGLVFKNDPNSDVELPGLPVTAIVTIKDHPPPTARFLENALEIDESQNLAEFTVEFVGNWPEAVSVTYESSGGSATAGDDFEETSGVLTFATGGGTQTIAIPVVLDALAGEGEETIRLVLRNDPDSGSRLPGLPLTATLTIKDHPPPTASLATNALIVDESDETAELIVELDGSWPEPVRVPYETSAVTATAGQDYVETRGELTFNPGETAKPITITVVNDDHRELDETLNLTIRDAPFVMVDGASSATVVTVQDDGDTKSACSLAVEDRNTADQEIVTLGFRIRDGRKPALNLRDTSDETKIIGEVEEDEVLCVIEREDGWYRVRLTDTVTEGLIGTENVYTIAPPRLQLITGTASIPFWDADSEPGCQRGDAARIVGNVGEADILRVSDRSSDGSCFNVQLTIDGRIGWVQSTSVVTTSAAGVKFVDPNAGLELRKGPDGESFTVVREEEILWASASGLDDRCLTWYKVRLKDGAEGWLGGGLLKPLTPGDALQDLPREVNLCPAGST